MAKISSRKQFNACVDETYAKKVQYEVDSQHLKDAKADLGKQEVIAKDAIRADHLTEEKLARLGLTYEITNNLKLTALK